MGLTSVSEGYSLFFCLSSGFLFRPKMDGLVELRGGLTAWSGLIDSVLCD